MFEDSFVESCGQLASQSRRWITVGSIGLQCLMAAALVLMPMLHPEALSFRTMVPMVVVPVLKKPPVVVTERRPELASRASSVALPSVMAATRVAVLPSMRPETGTDRGVAVPATLVGMGGPGGGAGVAWSSRDGWAAGDGFCA